LIVPGIITGNISGPYAAPKLSGCPQWVPDIVQFWVITPLGGGATGPPAEALGPQINVAHDGG